MQSTLSLKLTELNKQYLTFKQSLGNLEGQRAVLTEQIDKAADRLTELEEKKTLDTKAVEVVNFLQQHNRDMIKGAFEKLVSFALKSIYQKDYLFQLDFTTRGNLGEMGFKMKSPENQTFMDLDDCTAGGTFDIVSLALRFVLLQIISPKLEGFVILDEPTKMLSYQYRENEHNFYKYMAEKLDRQLIIITHSKELIDSAEHKILIGN